MKINELIKKNDQVLKTNYFKISYFLRIFLFLIQIFGFQPSKIVFALSVQPCHDNAG